MMNQARSLDRIVHVSLIGSASPSLSLSLSSQHYFPSPMEITTFSKEPVRQLACGHSFALALTASGLWSWGCGDGGVLGHGDTKSRESPGYVEGLNGSYIMQVRLLLAPPCLA
jgi:alpha-tubulin suppressor-like RCC1 family protein